MSERIDRIEPFSSANTAFFKLLLDNPNFGDTLDKMEDGFWRFAIHDDQFIHIQGITEVERCRSPKRVTKFLLKLADENHKLPLGRYWVYFDCEYLDNRPFNSLSGCLPAEHWLRDITGIRSTNSSDNPIINYAWQVCIDERNKEANDVSTSGG